MHNIPQRWSRVLIYRNYTGVTSILEMGLVKMLLMVSPYDKEGLVGMMTSISTRRQPQSNIIYTIPEKKNLCLHRRHWKVPEIMVSHFHEIENLIKGGDTQGARDPPWRDQGFRTICLPQSLVSSLSPFQSWGSSFHWKTSCVFSPINSAS
jgi:hypothetical protein